MLTIACFFIVALAVGIRAESPPDSRCEFYDDGTYYWVKVADPKFDSNADANFEEAQARCHNNAGELAIVPNERVYQKVVACLLEKLPVVWQGTQAWTGITVDPMTGISNNHPDPEGFSVWGLSEPLKGKYYPRYTNVIIEVKDASEESGEAFNRFSNVPKTWSQQGVVCSAPAIRDY